MIVVATPTGPIGQQVIDLLLRNGAPVRVTGSDPSSLAPEVRQRVEVVQGMPSDLSVAIEALAGAVSLFWHRSGIPTPHVWEAIQGQDVQRVVVVTGQDSGTFSPAAETRCRTLRLPFVLEDLLDQVDSVVVQGRFTLPYPADRPLATVAAADVASAAVGLLLDDTWTGQEEVALTGPDKLTPDQLAQVMSKVLERPVFFQQVGQQLGDEGTPDQSASKIQAASSVSFYQWCQDVLRPAFLASRADEIRRGLAHLRAADPVLAELIDKRPDYQVDAWRRELPVMDLFGCLLAQIIGQQISLKAAQSILGRLSAKFGGQVPSAQQAATLSDQELRDVGLTWKKARTVLDLAARFVDGRLSEHQLRGLSDDQILAELTQISGIGPWTVHGALLIYLHRGDVVPVGDILLKNTIKTCYQLDHVPSEQEVTDIAAAWRPYGSLGVNLLFAAAELDR
jgi:DNA-3-methyladenine glycosylase II